MYIPKPIGLWDKKSELEFRRNEVPSHLAAISFDSPLTVLYSLDDECYEYRFGVLTKEEGVTKSWVSHTNRRKYFFNGFFDDLLLELRSF